MKLKQIRFSIMLGKTIVLMLAAMVITIVLFSNVLYRSFEDIGLKITYDYNKKSLSQLSYNVTYINKMISNFCATLLVDDDVQKLMYSRSSDQQSEIANINRLQKKISSNSMVYSVVLYNGFLDKYYSSYPWIFNEDDKIKNIIGNMEKFPQLSPIPRILPKETYFDDIQVFTFLVSDMRIEKEDAYGVLAVNIKTDWLFENLRKLYGSNSSLLIVDNKGNVIVDGSGEKKIFDNIRNNYIKLFDSIKDNGDSIIIQLNNEKRLLTYLPIPNTDWILVNDEPYLNVFKYIYEVKNQTILATLIFLAISILISVLIAKTVYKPFGILLMQLKEIIEENAIETRWTDDKKVIQKAINATKDTFENYKKLKKTAQDLLRENILKAMLFDSNSVSDTLAEQNLSIEVFDPKVNLIIIIFKIDRTKSFIEMGKNGKNIIKYNISKILSELLSTLSKNQIIDAGNDEFVAVIEAENIDVDMLKTKIGIIQSCINKSVRITVSAFVSDIFKDINKMSQIYRETKRLERYRLLYGHSYVVFRCETGEENNEGLVCTKEQIDKIICELKENTLKTVLNEFEKFISDISSGGIDTFTVSIMSLATAVNNAVNQINANRLEDVNIDFKEFYSQLLQLETLEEIKESFKELFIQIVDNKNKSAFDRHNTIVNTIIDYINKEYNNRDLSLKSIAAEFKMSKVYLGKLFKDITDKSIAEYINQVRIDKAVSLLKDTNYSIREIMNKIGIESETNFYRLFRKFYGTTPKEYRMNLFMQYTDNLVD